MRGNPLQQGDTCHIWIGGDGARVAASNLTVEDRDATPIFEFDADDAAVEVGGVIRRAPRENWGRVSISHHGAQMVVRSG
ncbi:MAG: hypothetical protein HY054_01150 [Proteobacteria bacterium]|nr:hypothetical protein [Pseudomonadota bacterium]